MLYMIWILSLHPNNLLPLSLITTMITVITTLQLHLPSFHCPMYMSSFLFQGSRPRKLFPDEAGLPLSFRSCYTFLPPTTKKTFSDMTSKSRRILQRFLYTSLCVVFVLLHITIFYFLNPLPPTQNSVPNQCLICYSCSENCLNELTQLVKRKNNEQYGN